MALENNIVERCPKCGRIKMPSNKAQEPAAPQITERVQVEAPIKKKRLPDKVVTALWYVGYWAWLAFFLHSTALADEKFGLSAMISGLALISICMAPSAASRSSESNKNLLLASIVLIALMAFFSLVMTPSMLAFSENGDIKNMLQINGLLVSVFTISILECVRCAKKRSVPHTYARPAILTIATILYLCPIYVFNWLMDVLGECDEFFTAMWAAIAALAAPCLIVGFIFYLIDDYIYPLSVRCN